MKIIFSIFLISILIVPSITINSFSEEYPQLVSISINGEPGNGSSFESTLSSNGQFVAFMSEASDLVSNDRNHQQDIFVRDLINQKTYLVSVSSDGTQGAGESQNPSISGDGEKIVFGTGNALDSEDNNESGDIYLHDIKSEKTIWISKPTKNIDDDGNEILGGGAHHPRISDDGNLVFFMAEPNDLGLEGTGNLLVYDVNSKSISSLELDVQSGWPGYDVSGDGKKIVFTTDKKIDSFSDSDRGDVFVYDVDSEEFTWINQPIDEFKIPSDNRRVSIDYEGRYVVFQSNSPNLVEIDDNDDESFFLHDLQNSQTKLISIRSDGTQFFANSAIDVSGNGKFVLFQDRVMVVYDVELEKIIKLTGDSTGNLSGIDFEGNIISYGVRDTHSQISVSTNPPPSKIVVEEEEIEVELEPIVCEAEICVDDCNEMSHCTVEWVSEPITEPVVEESKELGIASFVDNAKDPQFYVDRYNNEPTYKEWFDENYSEYDSIYSAVGLEEPTIEFVPEPTTEQTISDVDSEPTCGTGTILKDGTCVVDTTKSTEEKSSKGGGCLIATATYDSELAPQVQLLREIRDNSLLTTESGTKFMSLFNDVYYSFSPIIADYERENPIFKEMVKIAITPMISSLSILNYVDMDSESSVLGYGISLILLNGLMYVGIPIAGIVVIRKRF